MKAPSRIPARRTRPVHRTLPVFLPVWLRHQVPDRITQAPPPPETATDLTQR